LDAARRLALLLFGMGLAIDWLAHQPEIVKPSNRLRTSTLNYGVVL
jgi:hypothetical protein